METRAAILGLERQEEIDPVEEFSFIVTGLYHLTAARSRENLGCPECRFDSCPNRDNRIARLVRCI